MYKHNEQEQRKSKLIYDERVLRSEADLVKRLRNMRRAVRYTSKKKQIGWYQIEIEYLQSQLRAWQEYRQGAL